MTRGMKLQSAMEYLMTYGWSILIIAIIISVLFYQNFFSSTQTLPFVCLGAPQFLCSEPTASSGGALSIKFGYTGSTPITITGLVCNITSPGTHTPSYETTYIPVSPNQQLDLTFQCPFEGQSALGTTVPVSIWFYYNTQSLSGLQQLFAKGVVKVNYLSLLWNVTEWTPNSNSIDLLPYGWVTGNVLGPINTIYVNSTKWSSLIESNQEGWSYSTDWHNHDVYNGIETVPFPISPLSQDNAPCAYPYNAHGYTATTYATMKGSYTFSIVTDDATEIFYSLAGSGTWQGVFTAMSANTWNGQPPTAYSQTISLAPGRYELAVDYEDICDPASLSVVLISPPPQP